MSEIFYIKQKNPFFNKCIFFSAIRFKRGMEKLDEHRTFDEQRFIAFLSKSAEAVSVCRVFYKMLTEIHFEQCVMCCRPNYISSLLHSHNMGTSNSVFTVKNIRL